MNGKNKNESYTHRHIPIAVYSNRYTYLANAFNLNDCMDVCVCVYAKYIYGVDDGLALSAKGWRTGSG